MLASTWDIVYDQIIPYLSGSDSYYSNPPGPYRKIVFLFAGNFAGLTVIA